MTYFITGDKHGNFENVLLYWPSEITQNPNAAVIILGDAGVNYYLNKRDYFLKETITKHTKCIFYCIRGNHDYNPTKLPNMICSYDATIQGNVWYDPDFPNIRYLTNGIYYFNGHKTLVIGGAYSVDKYYRLENGWSWFEDEQPNQEEKDAIFNLITDNREFDLVLTHTCPYENRPTDAFLPFIDQSTVDNSTEHFLSEVKSKIKFNKYCFGHFHLDRIEPDDKFIQYYHGFDNIEDVLHDESSQPTINEWRRTHNQ